MSPCLSNYMIEDKNQIEPNYVNFLCSVHQNIQKRMSS